MPFPNLTAFASLQPDDLASNPPSFSLNIGQTPVPEGVLQLIEQVEYESADGMADVLKLVARDPPGASIAGYPSPGSFSRVDGDFILRDLKLFQLGNEISLFAGYGASRTHIGRAIIRKIHPSFPSNGFPTIQITAYTKDAAMMDHAPEAPKKVKTRRKLGVSQSKRGVFGKKKKGTPGRRFKQVKFSQAVAMRAEEYGFELDIDETPEKPQNFVQKVGLTDYDFVQGLANLTGYLFWVDGDENGKWTIHFRDPLKIRPEEIGQEKTYTFRYGDGDMSTLLAFEPEIALSGSQTKITAVAYDQKTGKMIEATVEEKNEDAPETQPDVSGDRFRDLSSVTQYLDKPHSTASDVKIYLNDYSFEPKTNVRFTDKADLERWVRQWFRRHRENFILSRGLVLGVENLRALQIHRLEGLGVGLSGEYQFTKVRHILNASIGYRCEINCRRKVPRP